MAPDLFEAERPRLLGLAYRLLGVRADAEDVVQEAWLRWAAADRGAIERPEAWLTTVTSRLALDRLRSAQRRREAYVGPWLPEPTVDRPDRDPAVDPEAHAELAESLTLGFLAVLESLQPVERVVFILADVYEVPFADIAPLVGRSVEACRQIASRARRRVRDGRPRLDPPADALRVVRDLLAAVAAGEVDRVASLLAPDIVLVSDGGAERRAARRPVVGPHRVSRFLTNLARRGGGWPEPVTVNGQPGLLFRDPERHPAFLAEVEVAGGLAWRVHVLVNPAKLAGADVPADLV